MIQITVANRGSETATLHLLPTLWFRNTWSWTSDSEKPAITIDKKTDHMQVLKASHSNLGNYWLYCDDPDAILFTENETNKQRLFHVSNDSPYVKDGIHEYIVHGRDDAVNPENQGTKAAVHYQLQIRGGESKVIKLRLSKNSDLPYPFDKEFDDSFAQRIRDADSFYQRIAPGPLPDDMRKVQRQAFAGLLWNKQCYHFNVRDWLDGDPAQPPPPQERKEGRNHSWSFLDAYDIFSMPDKWEFPWFAAWDLSFHATSLAIIDPEFAKNQLLLLTRYWYISTQGQLPAYEWSFGDVNPPVQAWAAMHIYHLEKQIYGRQDRVFLETYFPKINSELYLVGQSKGLGRA